MTEIALYGAGGHAFAMLGVLDAIEMYVPKVIYDDNPIDHVLDIPVLPYDSNNVSCDQFCISIGDNAARARVAAKMNDRFTFPNLVHPSVTIGPKFQTGKGNMILSGAVIDTDVRLGDFVIVNNHATLSHNVVIGDFCHVAIQAAVAGGVTIGNGVLIGAGAVVLPGLTIGDHAIIGAGAVVTTHVPERAVVVGNPGKIIRYE